MLFIANIEKFCEIGVGDQLDLVKIMFFYIYLSNAQQQSFHKILTKSINLSARKKLFFRVGYIS